MIKYDIYQLPSGPLYRVAVDATLDARSEVFYTPINEWIKSRLTVGTIVSSPWLSLVARNVVFKGSVCSQ